jgi:hypothetical protein
LATEQSREIEELEETFNYKKSQLESLTKSALINEIDYRSLPEEYVDLIEVGMGGAALKTLLDEIDLPKLIAKLSEEVAGCQRPTRKETTKTSKDAGRYVNSWN